MDETLRSVLLTLEAAIHQTSVTEARERLDLATLAGAVGRQAHAGAQGAGFAIVAQEVRRLADQASASARDIGEIIARLEAGVDTTGRAVKELAGAAATASDVADSAQQRLQGMYGLLTEVAGAVARTSETAVSQAALAQEMAAAAEELRQQADTVANTAGAMGQRSSGTNTEAAYSALAITATAGSSSGRWTWLPPVQTRSVLSFQASTRSTRSSRVPSSGASGAFSTSAACPPPASARPST